MGIMKKSMKVIIMKPIKVVLNHPFKLYWTWLNLICELRIKDITERFWVANCVLPCIRLDYNENYMHYARCLLHYKSIISCSCWIIAILICIMHSDYGIINWIIHMLQWYWNAMLSIIKIHNQCAHWFQTPVTPKNFIYWGQAMPVSLPGRKQERLRGGERPGGNLEDSEGWGWAVCVGGVGGEKE